ncbi:recombinase family protein [Rossellomorea marisflavi]|uniref:recombinase family protein n=1 Tax=Rossellomorea marisflavi TaxID=189381 RepID=UPI00296E44B8|nr:recombinase family protein [Rossellomorea marisflavi]MDW4528783.1 recombinase family protein [Rossellomorea marisflavi]
MKNNNGNTQNNHKKVAVYTRNTSMTQPYEYHIHRDVQTIIAKCERAGLEVSRVYREPSSLITDKERSELKKMLVDASEGHFGSVVVSDVFTLSPDGEELLKIERELAGYDVELFSLKEYIDTSTEEGLRVFKCMCKLLNTKHLRLAAMQDIPLSQVAYWHITAENKKGA